MHVDPISDMLTRIRNAVMSRRENVLIPYSKLKENVLNVIKDAWFIVSIKVVSDWKFKCLDVWLSKDRKISSLKRVSKLWCRIYKKWDDIPRVLRWFWVSVISTSEWVMSWHNAFKKWIWWELMCEVF